MQQFLTGSQIGIPSVIRSRFGCQGDSWRIIIVAVRIIDVACVYWFLIATISKRQLTAWLSDDRRILRCMNKMSWYQSSKHISIVSNARRQMELVWEQKVRHGQCQWCSAALIENVVCIVHVGSKWISSICVLEVIMILMIDSALNWHLTLPSSSVKSSAKVSRRLHLTEVCEYDPRLKLT